MDVKRNVDLSPRTYAPTETKPATQACALTGIQRVTPPFEGKVPTNGATRVRARNLLSSIPCHLETFFLGLCLKMCRYSVLIYFAF